MPIKSSTGFRLFLLVLLLSGRALWAIDEYYSLSRSVRALGMGGAYYALSDDEAALFYNPAGLNFHSEKPIWSISLQGQVSQGGISASRLFLDSIAHRSNVGRVVNNLAPLQDYDLYLGATGLLSYTEKNFSLGALLGDTKFNVGLLGGGLDELLDITLIGDSGVFLAYAQEIDQNWSWGVTPKILFRTGGRIAYTVFDIAVNNQTIDLSPATMGGVGIGADIDLGAMYRIPLSEKLPQIKEARVGAALSNLLCLPYFLVKKNNPVGLSRYFSLGALVVIEGWKKFDEFRVAVDLAEWNLGGQSDPDLGARVGSLWKHLNWGVEAPLGWFIPRVGFHQGLIGVGVGIETRVGRVDFAYYGEEVLESLGRVNSQRFALRLAFDIEGTARVLDGKKPVVIEEAAEE